MAVAFGAQNNAPRFNNNSGNKPEDINTTGFILRNDRAGKFLTVAYWGKTLTVDIGVVPAGQQVTSDMARSAATKRQVMGFNDMFDLHEACEDILDSIKKTGTFVSTCIDAGQKRDCRVEISNGENIGMPAGIYLVIYKEINTQTKTTSNIEAYPFAQSTVYKNYNARTGQASEDSSKVGQFKKFVLALREGCAAFTMAQAHAVKEAGKYDKMASYLAMTSMASSMGVDLTQSLKLEKKTGSSGGFNRGNGGGSSYSQYKKPYNGQNNGGYNKYGNNGNRSGVFENGGGGYNNPAALVHDDPVDINLDAAALTNVPFSNFQ